MTFLVRLCCFLPHQGHLEKKFFQPPRPCRRWEAGCRLCQQSGQLQPKESSSPPQWAKLINGCDCQFPSEEPLEHVPGFSLQQCPRMSEWECAAISGSQGSAHPCEPAQRGPLLSLPKVPCIIFLLQLACSLSLFAFPRWDVLAHTYNPSTVEALGRCDQV